MNEYSFTRGRPLNGAEYLQSLRDGRAVYFRGELIKDVTTHAATKNACLSIAKLYDSLHDEKKKETLCTQTDDGKSYTHRFFKIARTSEELRLQRDAIAEWARISYGQLTRSPDYKASFSCALGVNPDFFGKYSTNAKKWHEYIQQTCLYMNHALINPPVSRDRKASEVNDVYVRVTKESKEGIYVSGAKVVATNAPLTHYLYIGQVASSANEIDENSAVSFICATNAPGVKIIMRQSYEFTSSLLDGAFDYPLASHFDENDAILVFDNVLIPWENVLIYRDVDKAMQWFEMGFGKLFPFHSCTRFAVKLDFITGLFTKALHSTGSFKYRGVQSKLGEVIGWRNTFWALSDAMWANPQKWKGDALLPNQEAIQSFRVLAPMAHKIVKEIIEETLASGLIYLPSSVKDFSNIEIDQYLKKYIRGSDGSNHQERVKLFKLLWELVGTEFAGRQELYEINNAGGPEITRLQCLLNATEDGTLSRVEEFAQSFMDSY